MKKKSKNKISAAAGLMNNKWTNKKIVKLDSPFSDDFKMESMNQHPSSVNPMIKNNQKHEEKKEIKKEKANLNFIKEQKENIKVKSKSF